MFITIERILILIMLSCLSEPALAMGLHTRASSGLRSTLFSSEALALRGLHEQRPITDEPISHRTFPEHYTKFLYAYNSERTAIVPYRFMRGDQLTELGKVGIVRGLSRWGHMNRSFNKMHQLLLNTLKTDLKIVHTPPSHFLDLTRMRYVVAPNGDVVAYRELSLRYRQIIHSIIHPYYQRRGIGSELICLALKEILDLEQPGEITLINVQPAMRRVLKNLGMPLRMNPTLPRGSLLLSQEEARQILKNRLNQLRQAA